MIKFKSPFPDLKNRKEKSKALKKIGKVLICGLAFFGAISLLIVFNLLSMLRGSQTTSAPTIPSKAVLTINFNQTINETANDSLFLDMEESGLTYFDLLKTINVAILDTKVKAIVAKINITGLGLTQIQELRKTIQNFRSFGKKAYIFSSGMGNLGKGTDEYYLATAFDKIYMQPNSDLGITGIGMEIPFIKDTLQKLGIEAEFYARYEYKNAASSLTQNQFTPQDKQQFSHLGEKIYTTIRDEIASSRGVSKAEVDKLINQAPLSAEEAKQAKLIDDVLFYSDLEQLIKQETKGKSIKIEDYAANYEMTSGKQPTIAFLTLEGTIIDGESSPLNLQSDLTIGAESVVKELKEIKRNKSVKALLLRINSPGGSYTASQTIFHELKKLNLPIVVSMGDYAASGGYFIALAGDKIFADSLTMTGSIGVLGGKIVTEQLWKKLGLNWEKIYYGKNAGIISHNHKFSPSEKAAFNKSLDNIYKDFTNQVATARNLDLKTIDKLARGRVWLGEEAAQRGLIDGLGGIDEALQAAKELAGIQPEQKFNLAIYPKPKTLAEKISEFIRVSPQVTINRLASKIGLDIQDINVLKHLQYDCMIPPMVIYK